MQLISNISVTNSTFFKYSEKVQKNACSRYELSNHLGNVLAVITDRRIQTCGMGDVMHYEAQVVSISDYYPFGMSIKDREWKDSIFSYRFGFNGKEKDNETFSGCVAFEARIYDSRLGRFFSVDPLEQEYPYWSPYQYAANCPISIKDVYGLGPGDEVVEGEGALSYAKRNNVSGTDNMAILDKLVELNPKIFREHPAKGSFKDKQKYWNDLSGKNWVINKGQRLEVGETEDNKNKASMNETPLIKNLPKIDVNNPVNSTLKLFKWYKENELLLYEKKEFSVPITDIIDFKALNNSTNFEYVMAIFGDRYYSKTKPQMMIENSNTVINLGDLGIFNNSNVKISYIVKVVDGKQMKSARYEFSGSPDGWVGVGFGSEAKSNNNRGRNTGIIIKYDLSNKSEFDAFKKLNKSLGGLPKLYGK